MSLLLDMQQGPFLHLLKFLDVESLSRASSSCRVLRTLLEEEWQRRDAPKWTKCGNEEGEDLVAPVLIGRSQASDARTRVIRCFQAERFALQDEQRELRRLSTVRNEDGDSDKHEEEEEEEDNSYNHERDFAFMDYNPRYLHEYEFFLRLSWFNVENPRQTTSLMWQGFVPVYPARLVDSLLGRDEMLDEDDDYDGECCIYLDLRQVFPKLEWNAIHSLLRCMHRPDASADLTNPLENLSVTVVAVSKTPEATTVPVVSTRHLVDIEQEHNVFGFDLRTRYLPGRLLYPTFYTNVGRRVRRGVRRTFHSSTPRLELLSIRHEFLSRSDVENILALARAMGMVDSDEDDETLSANMEDEEGDDMDEYSGEDDSVFSGDDMNDE